MKKNQFIWAAVILSVLITAGSFGPFNLKALLGMYSPRDFGIGGLFHLTMHRIAHFVAFGLLSVLASVGVESFQHRIRAVLIVAVFAVLIELGEFLGSTNPFETWDVRDDLIAAFAGLLAVEAALRIKQAKL